MIQVLHFYKGLCNREILCPHREPDVVQCSAVVGGQWGSLCSALTNKSMLQGGAALEKILERISNEARLEKLL